MGNTSCLPTSGTIDDLFSVATDQGIVSEISLDKTLTDYLSLASSEALAQQYGAIQDQLSADQLAAFDQELLSTFGGSTRVTFGGVGVVAVALSILFDAVAHRAQGRAAGNVTDPIRRIFGPGKSGIRALAGEYLKQVPGVANDRERMAEVTELYGQRLKLELIDHYERMMVKRRMSSASLRLWLNGAAFHLHMALHEVRLASVPRGSLESLRLTYWTGLPGLVKRYAAYLRANIRVTPPSATEPGLLVIEPSRNSSHQVQLEACEARSVEEALVARIVASQDFEWSREFFQEAYRNLRGLIKQQEDFVLQKKEMVI